jgi:hypothetical protein
MIKNDRQYRITKTQIDTLEQSLIQLVAEPEDGSTLQRVEEEAVRSQLVELRTQVEAYEALLAGEHPVLTLESFDELPHALIKARIAAGLSQKVLLSGLASKNNKSNVTSQQTMHRPAWSAFRR